MNPEISKNPHNAEFIADALYQKIIGMEFPPKSKDMYDWIYQALKDYGEDLVTTEKYKYEAIREEVRGTAFQFGYERALEVVAQVVLDKVSWEALLPSDMQRLVSTIRSLKTEIK